MVQRRQSLICCCGSAETNGIASNLRGRSNRRHSRTSQRKVRNTVCLGPPNWTKSRTSVLRFTLALQLVLRREQPPARSGPRQASFPCPHQPTRADYSPSCQADMAAIRPPLTVSGASQASLRHPPASFGIRPRCFLAAAAPSASRYGSRRSPCELRKPRSSVPLRTGPVSRNCNAWGQIDIILVHKKA